MVPLQSHTTEGARLWLKILDAERNWVTRELAVHRLEPPSERGSLSPEPLASAAGCRSRTFAGPATRQHAARPAEKPSRKCGYTSAQSAL